MAFVCQGLYRFFFFFSEDSSLLFHPFLVFLPFLQLGMEVLQAAMQLAAFGPQLLFSGLRRNFSEVPELNSDCIRLLGCCTCQAMLWKALTPFVS